MAHQYSTLLHDDSIRLLKLLSTGDDPNDRVLKCSLEDHRLSDIPSYEALSYAWGQPIFAEILKTHVGILGITENLASALRGLRFKDQVRYLWVDAVCINQNDTTEKSRQVAMMGLIYKSARQVICWLGQTDDSVGDAVETLKRLATSASRFGIIELIHGIKRTTSFSGHTKAQEDAFKELASTLNFSTLAKLYSNPYFTRLWIIQEMTLSRCAVLIARLWSISYDEFAMATAVLHSFMQTFANDSGSLTYSTLSSAWEIVSTKLAYTRKKNHEVLTDAELAAVNDDLWRPDWMNVKLLDIIDSTDSQCSDPRDLVYGLLSLSNDDTNDIDLPTDYAKSTSEVYTDFAKAYLVLKEIRILNHAGLQRISQERANISSSDLNRSTSLLQEAMPSWVPDWRVSRAYLALGGYKRPGFTAGFSFPTQIETVPTKNTKILISGFQVDSVAHVRRPIDLNAAHTKLPPRYATHEPTRASISALQSFCESHYQNARMTEYATGEDILTAFARTVLADGVYTAFEQLFPVFKGLPKGMVLLWRVFALLKINPDDTLDLAQHISLPNLQTGESGKSRAQSVRTAWLILTFMITALNKRALFITSQGYLGLGPALTEVGDSVVLFGGSETPFVMREVGDAGGDAAEKDFCILGDCYLHGIMYGELLTEEHQARVEEFGVV
ncbi:MAG: hypothetical protein Q9195_001665 [Heterodermia aff. obscurata]